MQVPCTPAMTITKRQWVGRAHPDDENCTAQDVPPAGRGRPAQTGRLPHREAAHMAERSDQGFRKSLLNGFGLAAEIFSKDDGFRQFTHRTT